MPVARLEDGSSSKSPHRAPGRHTRFAAAALHYSQQTIHVSIAGTKCVALSQDESSEQQLYALNMEEWEARPWHRMLQQVQPTSSGPNMAALLARPQLQRQIERELAMQSYNVMAVQAELQDQLTEVQQRAALQQQQLFLEAAAKQQQDQAPTQQPEEPEVEEAPPSPVQAAAQIRGADASQPANGEQQLAAQQQLLEQLLKTEKDLQDHMELLKGQLLKLQQMQQLQKQAMADLGLKLPSSPAPSPSPSPSPSQSPSPLSLSLPGSIASLIPVLATPPAAQQKQAVPPPASPAPAPGIQYLTLPLKPLPPPSSLAAAQKPVQPIQQQLMMKVQQQKLQAAANATASAPSHKQILTPITAKPPLPKAAKQNERGRAIAEVTDPTTSLAPRVCRYNNSKLPGSTFTRSYGLSMVQGDKMSPPGRNSYAVSAGPAVNPQRGPDPSGVVVCLVSSGVDTRAATLAASSLYGCNKEDPLDPGGCPYPFNRDTTGQGTHLASVVAGAVPVPDQQPGQLPPQQLGVVPGVEIYSVRVWDGTPSWRATGGDGNFAKDRLLSYTACEGRLRGQNAQNFGRKTNYRMVSVALRWRGLRG